MFARRGYCVQTQCAYMQRPQKLETAVSPLLANMNGPSNLNYSTEDFLNSGCIYELTAGRCFERYDSRSLQHPIHQDEILPVGPGRFSSGGKCSATFDPETDTTITTTSSLPRTSPKGRRTCGAGR
ncbi:uncharacterized protein LOC110832105 isoform X4 [Zootermopsis nevadensis]|uniref:uncharacterized protein LOC110832105 isoform X4 n=1 Tax=Zootermopsis nevadensis TaxID=136037 RepID=UPI000B8E9259|nr:uncharacterized protein LOC110832105 isoform X4 [Zootermopsis nevadensis]